ncbi:TorD/DmsD family molecular chaperone [Desulfosporosinus lacus]|uniref:Chaperone TorD involved in molybdoenzyme TorA maturation n=1 Tax=Desulfosporosinus lacus DSM 15449 TaxID=1121420 RepID=A0A1M5XIB7_9FIRM|nr:molecular chaperone TorD family protein [Desulfosporosinus lacus]SHH99013.1 chaperone TorD involved in molybdoenzyme TorA maturation [Desulfosporosinus lacus DSM 15449]
MDKSMIAELYLSFAAVFHRPNPDVSDHLEELVDLWSEVIPEIDEAVQKLATFCREFPPGEQRLNALWEHYIPLFETGEVEASPYASVYSGEKGLVLGKEAFNVQQFYANCGYVMGEKSGELPDHLAVELEFCALLARNGQSEALMEFQKKHLTPFLKSILPRIKNSDRPVYSDIATILEIRQLNLQKEGDFVG